jgi:hypothetical protein
VVMITGTRLGPGRGRTREVALVALEVFEVLRRWIAPVPLSMGGWMVNIALALVLSRVLAKADQTRIIARMVLMSAASNNTTICTANRGCSDPAQSRVDFSIEQERSYTG